MTMSFVISMLGQSLDWNGWSVTTISPCLGTYGSFKLFCSIVEDPEQTDEERSLVIEFDLGATPQLQLELSTTTGIEVMFCAVSGGGCAVTGTGLTSGSTTSKGAGGTEVTFVVTTGLGLGKASAVGTSPDSLKVGFS